MSAERGDQKPCTRTGCGGTMQFGREPQAGGPTTTSETGDPGWVCSLRSAHFERETAGAGGGHRRTAPLEN